MARLADEPERALPHGHAMVAADPLAEPAHATLVRLLAAAGRYPEAERHYAWARELLQREVAMPAGGPLDDAIHRVRRERREAGAAVPSTPAAAPVAEAAEPPSVATAHPLLGRGAEGVANAHATARAHAERDAIARAIAERGSSRLLLFAGEPGIGKTRLLDHLAERAAPPVTA